MISRIALVLLVLVAITTVAFTSASLLKSQIRKTKYPNHQKHHSISSSNEKTLPATFDWRDHGFNLPIWGAKSQCGGLTVAAAVADAISGADFVTNKLSRPTRCSAAQLIDCFDVEDGCNGGMPDGTITNLIKNSSGLLATDADYPWSSRNSQGQSGPCRSSPSSWKPCASKVTGFKNLPNDEDALQEILYREGPIMVVVSPTTLMNYTGGVLTGNQCQFQYYEHMMLLTGWGVRYINGNYIKYWAGRSDWGQDFGENGWINFEFGVNCTGIAGWARQVTVQRH